MNRTELMNKLTKNPSALIEELGTQRKHLLEQRSSIQVRLDNLCTVMHLAMSIESRHERNKFEVESLGRLMEKGESLLSLPAKLLMPGIVSSPTPKGERGGYGYGEGET